MILHIEFNASNRRESLWFKINPVKTVNILEMIALIIGTRYITKWTLIVIDASVVEILLDDLTMQKVHA